MAKHYMHFQKPALARTGTEASKTKARSAHGRWRGFAVATLVAGLMAPSVAHAADADGRDASSASGREAKSISRLADGSVIGQLCRAVTRLGARGIETRAAHPLVGTAYAARLGETIKQPGVLVSLLRSADFVLLGETHDNPQHHQIQACLLDALAEGRKASVVFEHIRIDKADALQDYLKRPDATPQGLGAAIQWSQQGWPPWSEYMPIAQVAFQRKLPIFAGDVTRDAIRDVARNGLAGLPEKDRSRIGVERPLGPPLETALRQELVASHCDLMPAAAFGGMAVAQRYRDAQLADAMISARPDGGAAVLIAGNGHVRADRAVPWHLRRRAPQSRAFVVALAEVDGSATGPADYVPKDPSGRPAVDIVVFTERAARKDPCAEMRKRFQTKPSQGKSDRAN